MVDKVSAEVLERLFLYVYNPSDLFNLRGVCRQWHALITNERFLNMYFHNRFGVQTRRPLEWVMHHYGSTYPPLPDYNTRYPAPRCLQGSGGVVVDTARYVYRAAFAPPAFPFNNDDYSVVMWLHLSPHFEIVTFNMRFNGFSLKFTLDHTYIRVSCSHAGGLQSQARIRVPVRRWFHIVLTYSSKFLFYINGHAYPLICTEGPLSENQMSKRTVLTDNDGYLDLFYEGYIKFISMARFADIQVLPCALTPCEICAINEQTTCLKQLNIGRYLLGHWANLHWYSRYLPRCIIF